MPPNGIHLDPVDRSKAVVYLRLGWTAQEVAAAVHCSLESVYYIQSNCLVYGQPTTPAHHRKKGRPRALTLAAEEGLLQWLGRYPISSLSEMKLFLEVEWDVSVTTMTISRLLARRRWSRKKAERSSKERNADLRTEFRSQMMNITAEQLVFLDEVNFREDTGWRRFAWAPIGKPARYQGDMTRGKSWSMLPAYTTEGYLTYGTKEGYFNSTEFLEWIVGQLLPHLQSFPAPRSVVVLDNVSIHQNPGVREVLEAHGCLVKYLPPYSPDFNPIELTFSVLKAWIRRHFDVVWRPMKARGANFGEFLAKAVAESGCDAFPKAHFTHATGGYLYEVDMVRIEQEISDLML